MIDGRKKLKLKGGVAALGARPKEMPGKKKTATVAKSLVVTKTKLRLLEKTTTRCWWC